MRPLFLACLLGLLFVGSPDAYSAVLYSNLGPGDTYSSSAGQGIGGPTAPFGRELSIASSFQVSTAGRLGRVELGLGSYDFSPSDEARVSLFADNGSGLPGTLIEDLGTASGFPEWRSSDSFLAVFQSQIQPMLELNTLYWIKVSVEQSDATIILLSNNTGELGDAYFDGAIGYWVGRENSPKGAMRIESAELASPNSALALLMGLAALIRLKH